MAQRLLMAAYLVEDFIADIADADARRMLQAMCDDLRLTATTYLHEAAARRRPSEFDGMMRKAIINIATSMEPEELYHAAQRRLDRRLD